MPVASASEAPPPLLSTITAHVKAKGWASRMDLGGSTAAAAAVSHMVPLSSIGDFEELVARLPLCIPTQSFLCGCGREFVHQTAPLERPDARPDLPRELPFSIPIFSCFQLPSPSPLPPSFS